MLHDKFSTNLIFQYLLFQYNDSDGETVNLLFDPEDSPNSFIENASFGIEQVPLTTVIIGGCLTFSDFFWNSLFLV